MNSKISGLGSISGKLRRAAQRNADPALDPLHIEDVACTEIDPNPDQPRKRFDEVLLAELAESIKQHGVMQPIVLRRQESGRYQIVAGERRWRAAQLAGLSSIPARIRSLTDSNVQILALIENIQRENLTAVEEADSIALIVEELGSQQEAALKLNKEKDYISKMCTVASLPNFARDAIVSDSLGDDVELLANLSRLTKLNVSYAETVVAFSKESDGVTRPYLRAMLKRAKDGMDPISPEAWAELLNPSSPPAAPIGVLPSGAETQSGASNRSVREGSPQRSNDHVESDLHQVPAQQLKVEVSVPSMNVKRAFIDLDRMPDKSGQIWMVDGTKRFHAPADEIVILRVVAK